jgi:hypothetical protein
MGGRAPSRKTAAGSKSTTATSICQGACANADALKSMSAHEYDRHRPRTGGAQQQSITRELTA